MDSMWYALDAMTQPVVLDRRWDKSINDYRISCIPLVKNKLKHLVCLGNDNAK